MKIFYSFSTLMFRYRFGSLLLSLLLLFLVAAFAQNTPLEDEVFLIATCLIMGTSFYAVEKITSHSVGFLSIGVVVILGNILGYFIPGQESDLLAAALSLSFLFCVIIMLFEYIFTKQVINSNTIIGAICLYIIIGLVFGLIYLLIDYFVPNSFELQIASTSKGMDAFLDRFFYYSFSTITTLGFGDITPISPPARYVSVVEALTGQLYLTILMARLVGLHLSQKQD